MASWRAPGSLLEAPGLDFPGSGGDFFEIFACFGARGLEAVPPEIPPAIPPEILASSHQEWPRIAQCQERQKRQELPRVKILSPERPEQKVGAGGPAPGVIQWNWSQVSDFGLPKFYIFARTPK